MPVHVPMGPILYRRNTLPHSVAEVIAKGNGTKIFSRRVATLQYSLPEAVQNAANNEALDSPAMDIYAIGCLTLLLATGKEVYEEEMQVGGGAWGFRVKISMLS